MKFFWLTLGSVSLVLGIIGAFLPILPTTPFLLLTTYCYARGSKKFHTWFTSSAIYKKYLEDYVQDKTMTLKQKLILLTTVTSVSLTFIILFNNLLMRCSLSLVILGHILYFGFYVKTKKK